MNKKEVYLRKLIKEEVQNVLKEFGPMGGRMYNSSGSHILGKPKMKKEKINPYPDNTIVKSKVVTPGYYIVIGDPETLETEEEVRDALEGWDYDEEDVVAPNILYATNTYKTLNGAKNQDDDDLFSQGGILHTQIFKIIGKTK